MADVTKGIETQTFTKDVPYLVFKLSVSEIRELYFTVLNGERSQINNELLEKLTAFLSDYDSGKYDKFTRI